MRLATWNLAQRSGDAAARLGSILADHGSADIVLLQEVAEAGLSRFCQAAGLDWSVHLHDVAEDLLWARGRRGALGADGRRKGVPRAVAIAGRGPRIRCPLVFPDLPLPEKVLAGWVDVAGMRTTVVCYHAPTGGHGLNKPLQAVRVAEWLASLDGPVLMGGDFNTPELDPPGDDDVRTHWHTGAAHLEGHPGDDLLVGPAPVHSLRDALRTHLAAHPEALAALRTQRPDGPLAVSWRPRHGNNSYRYDALWLTSDFAVEDVRYVFDEQVRALTDHALVLADVALQADDASI